MYVRIVQGKLCNAARKNGGFLAEELLLQGPGNEKVDKSSC